MTMANDPKLTAWQEIEARLASYGWQIRHSEREDSFHHIHFLEAHDEASGQVCKVTAKTQTLAYQKLEELIARMGGETGKP